MNFLQEKLIMYSQSTHLKTKIPTSNFRGVLRFIIFITFHPVVNDQQSEDVITKFTEQ